MEDFWIVDYDSLKTTVKSPKDVSTKEALFYLTLDYLLEKPKHITQFAYDYFEELKQTYSSQSSSSLESLITEEFSCSESYSTSVKDSDTTSIMSGWSENLPFYPKTDDVVNSLMDMLRKCILFRCLDVDQLKRLICGMYSRTVTKDEIIIRQYEGGDFFYLIESGTFDVFTASEPTEEPLKIMSYQNSGYFGELALLYDRPKTVTVVATSSGLLWVLDCTTFRIFAKEQILAKRTKYEKFISQVRILQELKPYDRIHLADAMVPITKKADEVIIKEGEKSDGMYFVLKGTVMCSVYHKHLHAEVEIKRIRRGGYFGEFGLYCGVPRAGRVTAFTDVELAFLDADSFANLLGPCMRYIERDLYLFNLQLVRIIGCTYKDLVKQKRCRI